MSYNDIELPDLDDEDVPTGGDGVSFNKPSLSEWGKGRNRDLAKNKGSFDEIDFPDDHPGEKHFPESREEISESRIDEWVNEAEDGYDVEELRDRGEKTAPFSGIDLSFLDDEEDEPQSLEDMNDVPGDNVSRGMIFPSDNHDNNTSPDDEPNNNWDDIEEVSENDDALDSLGFPDDHPEDFYYESIDEETETPTQDPLPDEQVPTGESPTSTDDSESGDTEKDTSSDTQDSGEKKNEKSPLSGFSILTENRVVQRIIQLYEKLCTALASALIWVVSLLGVLPFVGKMFKHLGKLLQIFLRIGKYFLPIALIVVIMIVLPILVSIPGKKSMELELPDNGGVHAKWDRAGENTVSVTVENTGDVIAYVVPHGEIYKRGAYNPFTWFAPQKIGECTGKSTPVDIEEKKEIALECDAPVSGVGVHVRVLMEE